MLQENIVKRKKNSHRLSHLAGEFCVVNREFSDLRRLMNTLI